MGEGNAPEHLQFWSEVVLTGLAPLGSKTSHGQFFAFPPAGSTSFKHQRKMAAAHTVYS